MKDRDLIMHLAQHFMITWLMHSWLKYIMGMKMVQYSFYKIEIKICKRSRNINIHFSKMCLGYCKSGRSIVSTCNNQCWVNIEVVDMKIYHCSINLLYLLRDLYKYLRNHVMSNYPWITVWAHFLCSKLSITPMSYYWKGPSHNCKHGNIICWISHIWINAHFCQLWASFQLKCFSAVCYPTINHQFIHFSLFLPFALDGI